MAMVSLLTIILFSLLAAGLVFSNLAKSRTDAFVDSNSSFSVAEAGLNTRAAEFREKLETYSGVTDINAITTDLKLANCLGGGTVPTKPTGLNYLGCKNYSFESSNTGYSTVDDGNINKYVAYTLVSKKIPQNVTIPSGDEYAGLNAIEYKYVIESTARKPVDSEGTVVDFITPTNAEKAAGEKNAGDRTPDEVALVADYDKRQAAATAAKTKSTAADKSSNKIDLSLSFTKRVISLFQFAIFYNGDLEFNSTSRMRVKGRVHSNANIYVQPAALSDEEKSASTTEFLSKVSAVGKIYNRVDAWNYGNNANRSGITKVLLTGNSSVGTGDCDTVNNCREIPEYDASVKLPLTSAQIGAFTGNEVLDGNGVLDVPSPGFTRKRNYFDNKIGTYYSRADMRLEMVPDRGTTAANLTPNTSIIPFNFTSVTTSTGTGTDTSCIKTFTSGSDPDANYIDPLREKVGTRHCNIFSKGQLQSLRQPVLVTTRKFHSANLALEPVEREILGGPIISPTETAVPGIDRPSFPPQMSASPQITAAINSLTDPTKDKILRALQVALVSTPAPVAFENLNKNFSDGIPTSVYETDTNLNKFKTEFKRLVEPMFPVGNPVSPTSADVINMGIRATLFAAKPVQVAALRDAWFLPAPIQRVETSAATSGNTRSSGFYDSREQRWITMLQTNIASLSVWNRDGLYVTADDTDLKTAYVASTTNRDLAFSDITTANYLTRGLAFDRSPVDATKTALISTTSGVLTTVANLKSLGLGSTDTTEGGLVLHASVRDDLNDDGVMNSSDIVIDKTDTAKRVLKKKPDNTNELDKDNAVIITDYYRNYPNQATTNPFTPKSPFAFAFTGGNYLPNSLILSSDQSIYVQGNFNNNAHNGTRNGINNLPDSNINIPSDDRLPASIIADTITVLSNECVSDTINNGVPGSQLNCGFPRVGVAPLAAVAKPMAINAAFLSNTDVSIGNLGTDRGYVEGNTTNRKYSGGVNNYIRLLEDWGNQYALNYSGSMISLGAPLEYSGKYISGGGDLTTRSENPYYNIPFRNFNYDDKFNRNEGLPPMTPKASYIQRSNFNRAY